MELERNVKRLFEEQLINELKQGFPSGMIYDTWTHLKPTYMIKTEYQGHEKMLSKVMNNYLRVND